MPAAPSFSARRNRLRRLLKKESGAKALLVCGLSNVRYLTGFTGDSSWLLLLPSEEIMISDTRYSTQLADECGDLEVHIRDARKTMNAAVAGVLKKAGVDQLAIEEEHLTLAQYHALEGAVPKSLDLIPVAGLVEQLRAVKDAWEIQETRTAVALAERGFSVIRSGLRSDQTEKEIRFSLEAAMRSFGATGPGFEPIVGVGPTAALPHAHAGDRRVEESPVLLVDWGAETQGGYRSDLTRVLLTGKPTKKMEKVYGVVLEALKRATAAIRPGVACADVDAIARNFIKDSGYGKYFGHGLGHGFGLEIHESVRMSPLSKQVFETGMVVTVEPGIYLPGQFGVRLEDDILVTADGHEVLSSVPREFDEAFVDFLA